jgi:hypothetical protein
VSIEQALGSATGNAASTLGEGGPGDACVFSVDSCVFSSVFDLVPSSRDATLEEDFANQALNSNFPLSSLVSLLPPDGALSPQSRAGTALVDATEDAGRAIDGIDSVDPFVRELVGRR